MKVKYLTCKYQKGYFKRYPNKPTNKEINFLDKI